MDLQVVLEATQIKRNIWTLWGTPDQSKSSLALLAFDRLPTLTRSGSFTDFGFKILVHVHSAVLACATTRAVHCNTSS